MNWRSASVAAGAGVAIVALLAFGLTRDPGAIPSPLPGREAPAFQLAVFALPPGSPPLDSVRLASLRGDVVVLNFWASWCLECGTEHAALSRVATRYAGTDVHFIGVLYNDRADFGRKWIEERGGQSYPSLLDPGSRTAIDYGLYGVPETFFIGRDGVVASKQIGPVTEALLVERIESLRREPVGTDAKPTRELRSGNTP